MNDLIAYALLIVLFVGGLVAENGKARQQYYNQRVEKLRKRQKRRLLQRRRLAERDK